MDLSIVPKIGVSYFWDGEVLMCRWTPSLVGEADWNSMYQIVLPSSYQSQVLRLAHEHFLSGHLGITKTYKSISKV